MDNQEKKPVFDNVKYKNEYSAEHYDRVTALLPKGYREELKAHAKEKGRTLNQWLLRAIKNAIDEGL